ncbi:MAG: ribosome small subunit-dependent GTPase A [Chlamydiia bacterium]
MDFEEKFSPKKRENRQARKLKSLKDRSKYKKTDQKKEATFQAPELPRGRIISVLSEGILVEQEGNAYLCELKGSLKKGRSRQKNLVCVGDFVFFDPAKKSIEVIEPRRTTLSRADHLRRRKEQLIAANIDQVLISVSVAFPSIKPNLIDRYIVACLRQNMSPIIVINKIDLPHPGYIQELVEVYEDLKIPVVLLSTVTLEGVDRLKELMKDHTNVFTGQSGVGKTSIINKIIEGNYRVKEVMLKTEKGSHTTTTSVLIPLQSGGYCIDTPGIKSFGLFGLEKKEIEPLFKEIHKAGKKCAFSPCSHTHEPDCAVKVAVEKGKIALTRYQSYLSLIEGVKQDYE